MAELDRIALEGIDDLVEDGVSVMIVGETTIRTRLLSDKQIIMRSPWEKRKIEINQEVLKSRECFLTFVNTYLANNGMYLEEAYFSKGWVTLYKLKGNLYREL